MAKMHKADILIAESKKRLGMSASELKAYKKELFARAYGVSLKTENAIPLSNDIPGGMTIPKNVIDRVSADSTLKQAVADMSRISAPAYNKGPYQPMFTKNDVISAGKK